MFAQVTRLVKILLVPTSAQHLVYIKIIKKKGKVKKKQDRGLFYPNGGLVH